MGFEDITNKGKEFLGNEENQDKINDSVDNAQEQHGDKLGKHGDKVNDFVVGQQEKRLGDGEGQGKAGNDGQSNENQN